MPLRMPDPTDEAYSFPLTIRHLLDTAMITSPDQSIVYRDQFAYTYRDFRCRVGSLASALKELGAGQGMTIAVMDWDSHRYLEAYFAIPMMGSVLQTVNVRLPAPQVSFTLAHAKAEILIVHRDFVQLVTEILPSLPNLRAIITISDGDDGQCPSWSSGDYEKLCASATPDFPFEDFDENAVATTFYTTGTTGNPKGVYFTHRQIVLQALACSGMLAAKEGVGFGYSDVYMPLTPMFHVHAWGMPYVATMMGVKQVYPGRYEPDLICSLRSEHGVSFSHCVPTVLRMILDAAAASRTDLAGWTLIIGGSALSAALCVEGRQRGMNLVAGYGMSETGPLIAIARTTGRETDEGAVVEAMTATVPAPLVTARIVDEALNDRPPDGQTRGEIVLRGPWLTPCYTEDPAGSVELWRGGWMHTKDIGTIDATGNIRIRDRLKDVIKSGGEWIDSIQLEELVALADGVAEAAVIAIPDAKWGERPLAVVVAKPGATLTLERLLAPVERAIAAEAITKYARLDRFTLVEHLPRTSVGKIDKKLLRTRYSEETPVAGA